MMTAVTTKPNTSVTSTKTTQPIIGVNSKWSQYGVTVAGDGTSGAGLKQLFGPDGMSVDDDNKAILVADYWNSRIVQWKIGEKSGQLVAGGHQGGGLFNPLGGPIEVLIDKINDSLIICDWTNRQVIRFPRHGTTQSEILLSNIFCSGLAMDNQRNLYVSEFDNDQVRRYEIGKKSATLVAGGYGKGSDLNQFNNPTYLFVDQYQNVYVSDKGNSRVMKWNKGAREGVIIVDDQTQKYSQTKPLNPRGLFVDTFGSVFVVDAANNRVIRWLNQTKQSTVIVGGNGAGNQANQFNSPRSMAFDAQGNLYVVDSLNNRVQQFSIL